MKKHSVLYKYFITYTAIILAVCLTASFAFFFFTFNQHKKSIEESNLVLVEEAQKSVDADLNQCLYISRKIVNWDFQGGLDTPTKIRTLLSEYVVNYGNFIDVILLSDIDNSSLAKYYNATGMVRADYFDDYYGFEKLTHQWISENISKITYPVMIQTARHGFVFNMEDEVNLFIVPLDMLGGDDRFKATVFVFNNGDIMDRMIGSFPENAANAMIISETGDVIACDEGIYNLTEEYKAGLGSDTFDGKKVYSAESHLMDWEYYIFADYGRLSGYFGTKGFIVVSLITLFMIVFGVLAAFIGARRSYEPVKRLIKSLPVSEFSAEENEFSIMQKMFLDINKKNEMLMENIEKLKDKKANSLSMLLTGDNKHMNCEALQAEFGFPADAESYVLAIFEIDDFEKSKKITDFEAQFCKYVKDSISLPVFVEGLPGQEFYVMVVATESINDRERQSLKDMISNVQEHIKNNLGVTATCTISTPYYNLSDTSEIIYSVICATNYRVVYGYGSIIDMEFIDKQYVNIDAEFFNCFFEFYNNLRLGYNESVVENLMRMKEIIQASFSPDMFRLAYINIVHSFAQYLDDEEIQNELTSVPKTIESAFENIEKLANKYFEIQGRSSKLKHEILKIVQSEYTDSELSISSIAERLNISYSYLRKYFKDNMGVTLYAYIDDLRITHAKRLLTETDLPSKEIARAAGYIDINNFNRKFKAKTGKTPLAYKAGSEVETEDEEF